MKKVVIGDGSLERQQIMEKRSIENDTSRSKEQSRRIVVVEDESREKNESNNNNQQQKRRYLEMTFQGKMINKGKRLWLKLSQGKGNKVLARRQKEVLYVHQC